MAADKAPSRTSTNSFHPSNPFSSILDEPIAEPRQSGSRSGQSSSKNPFHDTSPSGTPRIAISHAGGSSRQRSSSAVTPNSNAAQASSSRARSTSTQGHARSSSLQPRWQGERPLDVIKKETKVANRSASRHKRGSSHTDTIDALDTIGGPYHHDGPYEAVLASRNINKKYSPLEAVKDSNAEALRATPREFVQDSLRKHVPLQGTATVPVGDRDLGGHVMNYEEGADLMREPDAQGGAYKRWDGIKYHPNDYKGKGEPSYTYERDQKAKKATLLHPNAREGDMEMRGMARHRSLSNGAYDPGLDGDRDEGMQRSNTTGRKKLGDGIRRRLGSLRKKDGRNAQPAEQ